MGQIDATLRLVILAVAGIYAISWLGLGIAFRTYPKAVASFFLANVGIGAGTFWVTERATHPCFFSIQVADWLVIGGIAACRAGILFLARSHVRTRVLVLPLAIEIVATVFMAPDESSYFYRALIFNATAGWIAMSAFRDCTQVPSMARFSGFIKLLIAWPLLGSGLLFSVRALQVLAAWGTGGDTSMSNPGNYTAFLWAFSVVLLTINMAMVGLVVSGLLQKIRDIADIDPLTRCLSRRSFHRTLSLALEHLKQPGSRLVCAMVDLDHFKKINDLYGHKAGDAVLTHAVAVIQESLCSIDVLARYGGEEFVLLLPGRPLDSAIVLVDRMRRALVEQPCIYNGVSIAITASFGMAECLPRQSGDDVIRRADAAMYVAKRLGRNRVEVASSRATKDRRPTPAPQ